MYLVGGGGGTGVFLKAGQIQSDLAGLDTRTLKCVPSSVCCTATIPKPEHQQSRKLLRLPGASKINVLTSLLACAPRAPLSKISPRGKMRSCCHLKFTQHWLNDGICHFCSPRCSNWPSCMSDWMLCLLTCSPPLFFWRAGGN